MIRPVLGIDVGGANLKVAHSNGMAQCQPFALWKNPDGLTAALRRLIERFQPYDLLAVTMTGELCDCYANKREGVRAILEAVVTAAAGPAVIWSTRGRFVNLEVARAQPLDVAAANWLALATFAGRYAPSGPALMIDIGSTTTDIVPIIDGNPCPLGRDDPARLNSRELVYSGVQRTPLCALLEPPFAAELFATTLDVYLLLESLPEDVENRCDTADGRPATRSAAHARLARMMCADAETYSTAQARQIAIRAHERQLAQLCESVRAVCGRLPSPPQTLILSGTGEFLAQILAAKTPLLAEARIVSLTQELGGERSAAACAYAVAMLAVEENHAC